jgi:CheY-like chemotaxis protein
MTMPRSSCRVLIVEDNADSRQTLQVLLECWGHEVQVAEDGLRGVEKALSWRPAVAVVDIGLPVMDGYQVAHEIRNVLKDKVFLIALTGYCQPDFRDRALKAGFNVHMTKPADLDKLSRLLTAQA